MKEGRAGGRKGEGGRAKVEGGRAKGEGGRGKWGGRAANLKLVPKTMLVGAAAGIGAAAAAASHTPTQIMLKYSPHIYSQKFTLIPQLRVTPKDACLVEEQSF